MAIVNTIEKQPELKLEEETDPKKKKPAKVAKKKAVVEAPSNKTLKELRIELQKLTLQVKTGKESNTSLIRKLRKEIARKLTMESQNHNH